jgi:hypothetical protein
MFLELVMALKSTVVEFRFLQKAHIVSEKKNPEGTTS